MIKEDEKKLLAALIEDQEYKLHSRQTVEDVAEKLKIDYKRAYYIVHKWKFWEYGVSWRTGWIKDFKAAKEYLRDPDAERRKI